MPAYLDDPIPQAPAPERSGLSLWIFTAEALLTGFCIFMFTNALWAPLFAPDSAGSEESAWLRLLWLPVYGLTLLLVLLRLPMFMRALPAVFISGILIGLCYASLFWSIAPDVTSRRSLALAFTTLFGLYLGTRYKGRDLTQIVALTFAILAALSLLVSIGYPKMGVHDDINAGAWRGLWQEKNQMAAMMTLGFIAANASALMVPERRKFWIGVAVLIFFMVVMSRSKTSLLACMLSLGALPVLMALRRGGVLSILFVWGATTLSLIGGTVFFLMPEVVLKALGKDPTLTGRTDIWDSLLRLSDKAPWLGYGYKAFWTPDSIPAAVVREETGWKVPSAHNGWLDLLVQLGWVGVLLFSLCLVVTFFCALFRFERVKDGYFSVLILCLFSFLILSESFILSQNNLVWVLFVCVMTRLTANQLQDDGQGQK